MYFLHSTRFCIRSIRMMSTFVRRRESLGTRLQWNLSDLNISQSPGTGESILISNVYILICNVCKLDVFDNQMFLFQHVLISRNSD